MNRTSTFFVLLLCIVAVQAHKKKYECPTCHLCPIEDQGCCFTEDKNIISNGDHFNPNKDMNMYNDNYDYNCANFTCIDGYFHKEYYCPLSYKSLGTGCYHVGSRKLTFHEAEMYCAEFGSNLAQLDTAERAVHLAKDIKHLIGELVEGEMKGVFWLGANEYMEGGMQQWFNNKFVKDGYTNFAGYGMQGDYIAAYSKESYGVDTHWVYKSGRSYAYPLCQKLHDCEIPMTCTYKDKQYSTGEIIWKDPSCDCSWIECGEYGQVKAVTKTKPCCTYNGEVFGDGETVFMDTCSKLVCQKGKLVSYPSCASDPTQDLFVPITYNGSSSCYAIVQEYKTYEEAARYCTSHDSKLAEITSLGENEAVENYLINRYFHHAASQGQKVDFWIGGRAEVCDNGKLGHFHWTSSESRRLPVQAVYEDFCCDQPSKDSGAHCLYTTFTKEKKENYFCWANAVCQKKKYFMCEKCSSCEQIYKNVCYNHGFGKYSVNGELVGYGQSPLNMGYGYGGQSCYEEHCENGKIVTRTFVCSDEYKQVTPEVRRKNNNEDKNKINSLI